MPSATLATQEPVAGYTLRERIGAGGYGEVWKADAPGGLSKAVKFVYGCLDDERAGCELKALNRIKEVRHPFLLSLERIEVVDGQLVIITELADMSLKDRFKACTAGGNDGIPRDELLVYLGDAADALDYMNEHYSLQHLDVKPENLLIVGGRVKVADFGLVKEIEDHTMSLLGGLTPIYASPESFMGQPSRFSDQYSLAIVFQEMLTGVLPFPGKSAGQLTSQHLHARPRLTALPPNDRATIARALAKDSRERFPNCRALIAALAASGSGRPTAGPSSDAGRHDDGRRGDAGEFSLRRPEEPSGPVTLRTIPLEEPIEADVAPCELDEPQGWREHEAEFDDAPEGLSRGETVTARNLPTPPRQPRQPFLPPKPRAPQLRPLPSDATAAPEPPTPVPSPSEPLAMPVSAAEIVDLPPLQVEAAPRLCPTLFVGIGGTGARILRKVRRRMFDRFGKADALPSVDMLLFDTDMAAISHATKGNEDSALESSRAVPLPIRQPHEYRENSEKFLRWLSRRWLYNIPRSLQTEGIRPLGRLALADHSETVERALRDAIGRITAPQSKQRSQSALATLAALAGLNDADAVAVDATPRVYLIASTAGGTGSGMVLDMAYMVRKVLGQLELPAAGVCGVLSHATSRSPQSRELGLANTYACLWELQHYSRSGGFSGDPSCGIPVMDRVGATFHDTYLLHMGDDLSDARFDESLDELAEYLYLDCVTPAGRFFEQCRNTGPVSWLAETTPPRDNAPQDNAPQETGSASKSVKSGPRKSGPLSGDTASRDVLLRTFGLGQVGFSHSTIPDSAAEWVAKAVVARWRGDANWQKDHPTPGKCLHASEESPLAGVNAIELSLPGVFNEVQRLIACELGGQPERFFQKAILEIASEAAPSGERQEKAVIGPRILDCVNEILGDRGGPQDPGGTVPGRLQAVLGAHLMELAAWHGSALFEWLYELVDLSSSRVEGAHIAGEWLCERLRTLENEADAAAKQLALRINQLEQMLLADETARQTRTRSWFGLSRAAKPAETIHPRWPEYVRMRIDRIAHRAICALARSIRTRTRAVGDQLADLRRKLEVLSDRFDPKPFWKDEPANEFSVPDGPYDPLDAVALLLRDQIAELAAQLDAQLRQSDGETLSLQDLIRGEGDVRTSLPVRLRNAARTAVFAALRRIDLADLFFSPKNLRQTYGTLQNWVAGAAPRLAVCGGSRRFLLVCPQGGNQDRLVELVHQGTSQTPSRVFDSDVNMILCYEMGDVSLARVAAHLASANPELPRIAARLHTRIDVAWAPMTSTGGDRGEAR